MTTEIPPWKLHAARELSDILNMILIPEESAQLAQIYDRAAVTLQEEVCLRLENLIEEIEPIKLTGRQPPADEIEEETHSD